MKQSGKENSKVVILVELSQAKPDEADVVSIKQELAVLLKDLPGGAPPLIFSDCC